ncbi:hypothetical protein J2S04_002799 [Alicyclobacillus tengchongensis]|uniref:Uncharacterized protein n=1 Tax=Alicyclobacillus tolerans TaxID=90970 RepID=A0ABT9LZV9_9BACL|nr:hypothetical protein [Alicyclobacillus tengchongensis]
MGMIDGNDAPFSTVGTVGGCVGRCGLMGSTFLSADTVVLVCMNGTLKCQHVRSGKKL